MRDFETIEDLSSSYVHAVSRTRFHSGGEILMPPDGCWDIAFIRRGDELIVLRTGLTTTTVRFDHAPGDEILNVAFRPNTFMDLMPGEAMRDAGIVLEKVGKDRFRLGPDVLEIPRFDNIDGFIDRLTRRAIVRSNDVVAGIISGRPKAMSERTLQRHFLKTTGLTYKRFTQIERAQKAVAMLRMGHLGADVAFALGYADQAHMIRSIKAIMGQTPSQILDR